MISFKLLNFSYKTVYMKHTKNLSFWIVAVFISGYAYMASCTHDDEIIGGSGTNIVRGTEKLVFPNPNVSFDKSHSNVGWATAYLGSTALLTGRFNSFGFTSFNFDESNPEAINFEAWVEINTVNTGEPGRDTGCLIKTYNTGRIGAISQTVDSNIAIIKSKSVEFSKSDKSYIVKFDFTFHAVNGVRTTKELIGKLDFVGKTTTGSGATLKNVYGFSFKFSFLAKTDYKISSTSIADNVDVACNAIFRQTL